MYPVITVTDIIPSSFLVKAGEERRRPAKYVAFNGHVTQTIRKRYTASVPSASQDSQHLSGFHMIVFSQQLTSAGWSNFNAAPLGTSVDRPVLCHSTGSPIP